MGAGMAVPPLGWRQRLRGLLADLNASITAVQLVLRRKMTNHGLRRAKGRCCRPGRMGAPATHHGRCGDTFTCHKKQLAKEQKTLGKAANEQYQSPPKSAFSDHNPSSIHRG